MTANTAALASWLVLEFARDWGLDANNEDEVHRRCREAAAKAVCELENAQSVVVSVPYLVSTYGTYEDRNGKICLDFEKTVSRSDLEQIALNQPRFSPDAFIRRYREALRRRLIGTILSRGVISLRDLSIVMQHSEARRAMREISLGSLAEMQYSTDCLALFELARAELAGEEPLDRAEAGRLFSWASSYLQSESGTAAERRDG